MLNQTDEEKAEMHKLMQPQAESYKAKMDALAQMASQNEDLEMQKRQFETQDVIQGGLSNIMGAFGKYAATPTYSNIVTGTQMPDYSKEMSAGMAPSGIGQAGIKDRMQSLLQQYKSKAMGQDLLDKYKQQIGLKQLEGRQDERLERIKAGLKPKEEKPIPSDIGSQISAKENLIGELEDFEKFLGTEAAKKAMSSSKHAAIKGIGGIPYFGEGLSEYAEEKYLSPEQKEIMRRKQSAQLKMAQAEGKGALPKEQIFKQYDVFFPTLRDDPADAMGKIRENIDRLKAEVQGQRGFFAQSHAIPQPVAQIRQPNQTMNADDETLKRWEQANPGVPREVLIRKIQEKKAKIYANK